MNHQRARPRVEADLLALIAVGGAVGALLRYAAGALAPQAGGTAFPWVTFGINVLGASGLALLHGYVPEHPRMPRRVRAVLGAGALGGFTTFSTYAEETRALLAAGAVATALLYLVGTLVAAVLAVETARLVCRLGRSGRSR